MSSTKSKEKKKKKKKNDKKKSYDNNVSAQTTLIADVKPAPLYLRKMFVGGLHPYMTKEDLIKYFNQFGQVEKGIIMTDKVTGRSRGFGFIIFSNKETIDKIMSISNCHFLCGKWIECKRAQPKEQCIKMLSENNTYPSLNYFSNDNLVLNDIITDHSKSLLGDKVKSDMNLFMYQNYIPKDQIKYFLKNANQLSSSSQTQSITSNSPLSTASNRTTTNSVSNIPKHTFQNYFNNCITNMQNYNYFHYKLFDSTGKELTKLKLYKNSNKIRVFPIEMDHSYKNNSNEVPSNEIIYTSIFYPESKGKVSSDRKEESDNEVDVSSDFVEVSEKEYSEHNSDDCFGPNRQRGKAKLDGNQGDFRPY